MPRNLPGREEGALAAITQLLIDPPDGRDDGIRQIEVQLASDPEPQQFPAASREVALGKFLRNAKFDGLSHGVNLYR
jgi:hypothetical protein